MHGDGRRRQYFSIVDPSPSYRDKPSIRVVPRTQGAYVPNQTVASYLPPLPPHPPQEPRVREAGDGGREERLAGVIAVALAANQREVSTQATRKRFSKKEIERFIALAGLDVAAYSDVSVMTPFFQGLEEDKGHKL